MDAKQLAKLIRKNAAKAQKIANARDGKAYDKTLTVTNNPPAEDDESIERDHFFKEMKRREF
ncbi:MAG TPA: hypothetical protein VJ672_08070 [Gemmatimonadaceae bacterium]|nr:hypothetical protein [Gemmatimonadaceae bacterium]